MMRSPLSAALFLLSTANASAGDVTVVVTGIATELGSVRVALHDGAAGFPQDRREVEGQTVLATVDRVTVVFEDVAPGRYAIAAFHDENDDAALSTNFLGLPIERYGFSRDARGTFGPPPFAEAALEVGAEPLSLTITLER